MQTLTSTSLIWKIKTLTSKQDKYWMSKRLKPQWGPIKHTKRSKAKNHLTTPWLKKEHQSPKSKQSPRTAPQLGIESLTGKTTSRSVQSPPSSSSLSLPLSRSKLPQRTTKVTRALYWRNKLIGCLPRATLTGSTKLLTRTWSSILRRPPRNSRRGRKKPSVRQIITIGSSHGISLLQRL